MLNNKSISVSVWDDELEELDRKQLRLRRKRKKLFKTEVLRNLFQYWPFYWGFFIFAGAIFLILYESRSPLKKTPQLNLDDLNRLDPTTRVVHGVRERCLEMLPSVYLERLQIPMRRLSRGPVKTLLYTTANEGEHNTMSEENTDSTRSSLFTGNQTLGQRGEMFKVNETVTISCGFYNERGGFKISNEDKEYMKSCEVVVSTCTFGGGDDLYQPIGMTKASLRKVCYVAFWDEVTVISQESVEHRISEDGFIGKWRIVVVRDLPFADQRLNGKIPKMLVHRLFPHSKYSIWVDSKSQFRRDPLGVVEALLWRTSSVLALSEHGARSNVYDEGEAVVEKHKAKQEEVVAQLTQYRSDGLPKDKRINGKKALAEASVIVREHTPLSNMFMCLWFNEVVRFTSRDQLSFPYVLWRFKDLKNINMFPVCTRKDLVNNIGHTRKAKPLSI